MRMRIEEIGPKDCYHSRGDLNLIGRVGEWEWESGPIGDWESGWMHFDEPILDWKCWYFIQVKVTLPPTTEAHISNRDEPATVSLKLAENRMKWGETILSDVEPISEYARTIKMEPTNRHGHPDFYRLCEEEMDLHSRKNHDYAAGGNPLGNFNRVSAILAMYPGLKLSDPAVVAITYMMKQLDASLWMLSNGHVAQVEGQKERWQDISVYSKIISILISEGGKNVKDN